MLNRVQSKPCLYDASAALQELEVEVQAGPGMAVRMVTVAIDAEHQQAKTFLGGWRDKRNGAVYHNAVCQTDRQQVRWWTCSLL